jgi:hypothetical protein
MASQVLSGSSNVTYTNNTGQNVRIVINFMASPTNITWAGVSIGTNLTSIGRNLAAFSFVSGAGSGFALGVAAQNAVPNTPSYNNVTPSSAPTELMLAAGQTFSATCGAYNIVIIPEAG